MFSAGDEFYYICVQFYFIGCGYEMNNELKKGVVERIIINQQGMLYFVVCVDDNLYTLPFEAFYRIAFFTKEQAEKQLEFLKRRKL